MPARANVKGTAISARRSVFPWMLALSCSDSSMKLTTCRIRVLSPTLLTRTTILPSSTTVLAKTEDPFERCTARGSPVMDDWLTMATPSSTMPSTGMAPPSRTTTRSPSEIWLRGTLISVPSSWSFQTFSTLRARLSVRLSMECRLVQYASVSPSPSRSVSIVTVRKSRIHREARIADASRTSTLSLPCRRAESPFTRKGIAEHTQLIILKNGGRRGLIMKYRTSCMSPSSGGSSTGRLLSSWVPLPSSTVIRSCRALSRLS